MVFLGNESMRKNQLARLAITLDSMVQVSNSERKVFDVYCNQLNLSNPFSTNLKLRNHLINQYNGLPKVVIEAESFIYFMFEDDHNYFYLLGPFMSNQASRKQIDSFRTLHNLPQEFIGLQTKSYHQLLSDFGLSYTMLTDKEFYEEEVQDWELLKKVHLTISNSEIEGYRIQKTEEELTRLSYEFEVNYMLAIEFGRFDYMSKKMSQLRTTERIGKLADKAIKQIEYRTVSSITLACRAAIRGGLIPAEAYTLSELYLQRLEKCRTEREMEKLDETMTCDFILRVKEVHKKQRNHNYVEQSKVYIKENVYKPLKVCDVAKVVGVNADYLSRKFTEQMGMNLSQYITKVKLGAAEYSLKHTKQSIVDISASLCFSSHCHFGHQFKKEYGMTPLQYRRKYFVIDVKV